MTIVAEKVEMQLGCLVDHGSSAHSGVPARGRLAMSGKTKMHVVTTKEACAKKPTTRVATNTVMLRGTT